MRSNVFQKDVTTGRNTRREKWSLGGVCVCVNPVCIKVGNGSRRCCSKQQSLSIYNILHYAYNDLWVNSIDIMIFILYKLYILFRFTKHHLL